MFQVVVSGVTKTPADVALYANCTLLATSFLPQTVTPGAVEAAADDGHTPCKPDNAIEDCIEFLVENEFIILQNNETEGS